MADIDIFYYFLLDQLFIEVPKHVCGDVKVAGNFLDCKVTDEPASVAIRKGSFDCLIFNFCVFALELEGPI